MFAVSIVTMVWRPYAALDWQMFAVSIVTMVILAATQPAVSALLKPMLDGSFVHKDLAVVNATAILLVVIFFIRGVCGYLGAITMEHVAGHIVMETANICQWGSI